MVPIFMVFVIPYPDWVLKSSLLSFMQDELVALNEYILRFGNYIAAAIFILAASTDGVDGYIARKHKMVTRFGIFLDPMADKLLVTAALIALVQRNEVSGWAAMIIIAREYAVTGLRLVASGEGVVIAASIWGKVKTVVQIVAISASLMKNFPLSLITGFPIDQYAMFLAVIITLYSGYDYIAKNLKVIDLNNT